MEANVHARTAHETDASYNLVSLETVSYVCGLLSIMQVIRLKACTCSQVQWRRLVLQCKNTPTHLGHEDESKLHKMLVCTKVKANDSKSNNFPHTMHTPGMCCLAIHICIRCNHSLPLHSSPVIHTMGVILTGNSFFPIPVPDWIDTPSPRFPLISIIV